MIKISVVIPTHGRPASLGRCLATLALQRFPRDAFEVIVVDDGGTPAAALGISSALDEALHPVVIRQPKLGPGAARMTGLRATRGEILAFLDDDCGVPPDYLSTVDRVFATHPDLCVAQVRLENPEPENIYGVAWKVVLEETLRLNLETHSEGLATSPILGGVMACRRELFGRAGFDPALRGTREDADLRYQLAAQAIRVHYAPEIWVCHYCRRTLKDFVVQHVGYGRGEFDLRQKWGTLRPRATYPRLLSWRSFRSLVSNHGLPTGALVFGLFWVKRYAGIAGLLFESAARRAEV